MRSLIISFRSLKSNWSGAASVERIEASHGQIVSTSQDGDIGAGKRDETQMKITY